MIRKSRTFGPKRLTAARHSGWFCLANRRLSGGFVRVLAGSSRDEIRTNGESVRRRLRANAYKNEGMSRAGETLFLDLSRRGETFQALCTPNLPKNECKLCPKLWCADVKMLPPVE